MEFNSNETNGPLWYFTRYVPVRCHEMWSMRAASRLQIYIFCLFLNTKCGLLVISKFLQHRVWVQVLVLYYFLRTLDVRRVMN
jgi:hypothetical protein